MHLCVCPWLLVRLYTCVYIIYVCIRMILVTLKEKNSDPSSHFFFYYRDFSLVIGRAHGIYVHAIVYFFFFVPYSEKIIVLQIIF